MEKTFKFLKSNHQPVLLITYHYIMALSALALLLGKRFNKDSNSAECRNSSVPTEWY